MRKHIPSHLQKHQPRSATSPDEMRRLAERAWHERGVLMVDLTDPALILDFVHRQALENVGKKIYGERRGK